MFSNVTTAAPFAGNAAAEDARDDTNWKPISNSRSADEVGRVQSILEGKSGSGSGWASHILLATSLGAI